MAAILLIMIVLPSAVLGTFAWRAIENEKLVWRERQRQTYRELARLASREIDRQLREVEGGWNAALDRLPVASAARRGAAHPAPPPAHDPLIAGGFVLSASEGVVYPLALKGRGEPTFAPRDPGALERERDLFERLMSRGEELEYPMHNPTRAIAAYREAQNQVTSPELRSMFASAIGRAQMKAGDWPGAVATYRDVLARYPEVRDLDKMVVRFLAQYQISSALGEMGHDREATQTLLALNQDLLARSDEITALQYAYYSDLIQSLSLRLLSAPDLPDRDHYRQEFRRLGERTKKRMSQKYLIQVLKSELDETVMKRRHFSPRVRYISDRAEGDPFLLAYRNIPDAAGDRKSVV